MLEILFRKSVNSTHEYVLERVKSGELSPPLVLFAKEQTSGIGSRGNSWLSGEGNLFVTFALKDEDLPDDIVLSSISIYFSMILKEYLSSLGSKLWVKWPNDLYLQDSKIGGVMSIKTGEFVIVSIGLNCISKVRDFGVLDVDITPKEIVERLSLVLENPPSWKNIFSKFRLEFLLSKKVYTNIDGERVSLQNASLCEDGSIEIANKKVYSLR